MSLSKLQFIFPCFSCNDAEDADYPDEKVALLADDEAPREAALIADDVVGAILRTNLTGPALQVQLDSIVGTYGWTENLAKWILEKLSRALQWGHDDLGPAVRNAYNKSLDIAMKIEGFVIEHPVFCTVVALGVLALISPWVLGALGFVELGIEEGSFAARWMSTYAGFVPKGSLFSFLQRLGMTLHWF